MRCLPGSMGNAGPAAAGSPCPPLEVVASSVALLVECAHMCGTLEVEALVACLEHASQVGCLLPSAQQVIEINVETWWIQLMYF